MRAAYTTAAVADHAQFVEAVRERRITPSPGELRRRLQELGRKRRAAECELIVEAVRTAGGRLFVEYVNEVIKAHVSAGDAEAALRTFGRIGEYRLEPDVASYTIVVNGLVRQRLLDKADSLLDEMRTKRVHPDGVFFSKLLTAYATIGDVERSIKTLGEVRRTRIIPAHETLCTVLQLFHKHRLFREIGELVTMMDEHYGPTQVTVAARMTVLMKEKRWDEIDELWRKLPSFRVRPNTLIYNILIQAARHRGRPERAIAIYDEMRQARLRPDAHSISLLLNLYAKAGNRERVQELLATPPLSTRPALERTLRLRSVVHGAARGQHVELVQSTLGALRAVNGVDRWTVGVALAAFAQAKMREPAEALLKEFPAFRTQPSVLNSMLFLYANMDLLTEAENLFLSLDRKDSAAFAIMFEMYERLGKPEEARRVREAHQAAFPRQRLDRHRPGEPDEPAHMGQPFEREI